MTRILLFVQTGDGRPKCVAIRKDEVGFLLRNKGWTPQRIGIGESGQRWWLVECEDAEAGRWTLLKQGFVKGPLFPTSSPEGRILASGGKHAS